MLACFLTLLSGVEASKISAVKLSDTGLANADAAALQQALRKLHAIEHIDLSLNRGLDSEAAAVTLHSLAGKRHMVW